MKTSKKTREKMIRGVRRGCVRLKGAIIGIDDEDNLTFTVTVDGKTFHFQARTRADRELWIRALEDIVQKQLYGYTVNQIQVNNDIVVPTLEAFDKKLGEADAYLQLLIEQVKKLEIKMCVVSEEDKVHCECILLQTNKLMDQVKHSIVMLQIAKNTAFPPNGAYRTTSVSTDYDFPSLEGSIEYGTECEEHSRRDSQPLESDVPEVSYSSSEDDFYDAYEDEEEWSKTNEVEPVPAMRRKYKNRLNISGNDVTLEKSNEVIPGTSALSEMPLDTTDQKSSIFSKNRNNTKENVLPTYPDGSIDYDSIYEDQEESDVTMQGSVVTHLISQVKIGMDLTKVALPTFILERRSLLEMYADYLAHPDLFLKANDLNTPEERMLQIVRWYLSSYHAGRNSSIAKKPYNPILGEVFRCHWDVPEINKVNSKQSNETTLQTNSDVISNDEENPLPWTDGNQLIFLAEQVSHHPPISAFYAEHKGKEVSLCANVWTKSKFLGLSVAVHNVGQGIVRLLKHKEEYISTFPSGYGRSILTVPWIELGGSVTITCPQTGYHCNIEFLTKPFYGGKKHRITAEVFAPKAKKAFVSINGEWNGSMEAKYTDGRIETFVDTKAIEVTKKRVRKVSEQDPNESRVIWKEVTLGLKIDNVDKASQAKAEIEQKQRNEAELRRERGEPWIPKWFIQNGESWEYKNSLEKRLDVTFTSHPS
ncbi:oxysterol-binding protein-related protein 9 isoform X2 [Daktulosphaira vitifoliae]|uniref:oxysterol-binding protein-related protein 9 isoform X2 n=1 Tax=Daktulosphaira vitifoliae TaxID=58002 RepID=UPI0021AAA0C9|nr:oxysterol-binding protein-related protein 9 isoform X2 [Daktulosphaira vitifoliae]